MRSYRFVGLFLVILCTKSCAGDDGATRPDRIAKDTVVAAPSSPPDSFPVGKLIDTVTYIANATQSYALYIPATHNKNALPVVYFFDPHASGSLPLRKYQQLANTYGFILIGSNNSRNGNSLDQAEAIWQNLFDDTKKRLNIDPQRIYTAGFSGGAKVAGYVALQHPGIKGVIANGAALPDGAPADNYPFSFTAIAGEGDMNMTELVAINAAFDKTSTPHRIILFNGKHEWAPEATMNEAFAGLQFDAMRNKGLPVNEALINSFTGSSKSAIEKSTKENKLVQAVAQCTLAMNLLKGVTNEISWFEQKAAAIASLSAYKQQLQARQQLLEKEQQIKGQYMQQFQQGDMNYWTRTISDLQAKAKAFTADGAMYQRLLAYLSLAFYSYSNQLIKNNQNDPAQYFVTLYKMADPTNSEAWYFSAILQARKNDKAGAEKDLLNAVANGFNDKDRLHAQPEFRSIGMNFSRIEKAIK
jgi:predicted esterase